MGFHKPWTGLFSFELRDDVFTETIERVVLASVCCFSRTGLSRVGVGGASVWRVGGCSRGFFVVCEKKNA